MGQYAFGVELGDETVSPYVPRVNHPSTPFRRVRLGPTPSALIVEHAYLRRIANRYYASSGVANPPLSSRKARSSRQAASCRNALPRNPLAPCAQAPVSCAPTVEPVLHHQRRDTPKSRKGYPARFGRSNVKSFDPPRRTVIVFSA